MAVVVDIARAVTNLLKATTFSMPVTAERYYLPEFDLKDIRDIRVSVVPAELDEELLDRARDQAEYTIHVAVQQRVIKHDPPGIDNDKIDALMHLVEEIDDLFRHKRLVGYDQALWAKTENKPIFDPKHLKEHGLFTSLLAFTFRLVR